MITLKKLDSLILKSCSVVNNGDSGNDYYAFTIDFNKLNGMLKTADKNLHPLVEIAKITSKPVTFTDIQSITEYIHKPEELKFAMSDKTEILEFLIYCAQDKTGKVNEFKDGNGNVIDAYDAYKDFEDDENYSLNKNVVEYIVSNLPMYMVLVLRSFNQKSYKYDYKIYIRSNYEMVSYFKAMTSEEKKDNKQPAEEKKN